jgi:hypothetical protein
MKYTCTFRTHREDFYEEKKTADIDVILSKPIDKSKPELPLINFCVLSNDRSKRTQAIYTHMNCIMLDYDKGYTIEDFSKRFKDYFFWLYTTSSHEPELHKYRVIIPLETPIDYKEYRDYVPALRKFFPNIDHSSFDKGRGFYMPGLTPHYTYFRNEGKMFNFFEELSDMKKQVDEYKEEQLKWRRVFGDISSTMKNYEYISDTDWDKCSDQLDKIIYQPDGSGRYSQVLYWIGHWKKISKDDQKVKYILDKSGYHNAKAFRNLFK